MQREATSDLPQSGKDQDSPKLLLETKLVEISVRKAKHGKDTLVGFTPDSNVNDFISKRSQGTMV